MNEEPLLEVELWVSLGETFTVYISISTQYLYLRFTFDFITFGL